MTPIYKPEKAITTGGVRASYPGSLHTSPPDALSLGARTPRPRGVSHAFEPSDYAKEPPRTWSVATLSPPEAIHIPTPKYQPLPIGPDNPDGLRFFFMAFDRSYVGTLDTSSGNFRFEDLEDCKEYYSRLHLQQMLARNAGGEDAETSSFVSSEGLIESYKKRPVPKSLAPSLAASLAEGAGFRPREL
ncbi:hypothetical protein HKX48_004139 [Thoreauomyces humboldtii]|nr:hypothetical protein HKX48_004139 [Thoreauomyces humboldtii]